jgi:hypothetical protein
MRAGPGGKQRLCAACQQRGHNVQSCTSPAAATIRSLRARLHTRPGGRKKPGRTVPLSSGVFRQRARKQYTKHAGADRRKVARRTKVSERRGHGLLSSLGSNGAHALKRLQEAGYVEADATMCV